MRTQGAGLRTSAIIRQVYSKKSFLTVDSFAKLYFNRVVANRVFLSLTHFKHGQPDVVFNTAIVYKAFSLDVNQLTLNKYLTKSSKIHYNNGLYCYSRFYTYFNALGSISSVNRLHNIIISKYGLTYALMKFSRYNFNKKYILWSKDNSNRVSYSNRLFKARKKSRRAILFLLNELRLINNKKHNILDKVKLHKDKYVKAGSRCLSNMNRRLVLVDESITSKNYKFNYFIYLLLKIFRRRNITNIFDYIKRKLAHSKRLSKYKRISKKRKLRYYYSYNVLRNSDVSNKFNTNENKSLTKQLLFHDSLLQSTRYRSHKHNIFKKSSFYIKLLKFSGLFNKSKSICGVGRFYRVKFKPRRNYIRRF